MVPFGAALGTELEAYYRERQRLPMPAKENSAFFASRAGGRAVHLNTLESVFARLRTHVGLQDPQGGSNIKDKDKTDLDRNAFTTCDILLRSTGWLPGTVKALMFRHICHCCPPTLDTQASAEHRLT